MITHFPTPYEDEWWYSVLCRYYLSTGIKQHGHVKEMLFGYKSAPMGTFFPNGMIQRVVKQLPRELFDIREILLNNTPLKYYTRLYPKEEQEYIIQYISEGGSYPMSSLWKNYKVQNWKPRYCPMCIKEDPEPYYHLSHQFPIVSCCLKHRCKLNEIKIQHSERELKNKFMCLQLMKIDEIIQEATDKEIIIATIANEYQSLPLETRRSDYNNLITGLFNKGYWKTNKTQGVNVDGERLREEVMSFYGESAMKVFGNTFEDRHMLNKLKDFQIRLPEKFILLQGMVGMSTAQFLGEKIKDELEEKVLRQSKKKALQSIKSASTELGLLEWQVRAICKYYGIKAFWVKRTSGTKGEIKTGVIRFAVDERELREIRAEAERLGFRKVGDYVINCVRYVRKGQ